MLQKLSIKNIALIKNAEINFSSGLNVLSGETGSGKSVIIEALNFVLGAKAEKTLIRSGETECFVQAVFDVCENNLIAELFTEFDFEVEDELIIQRKFNIDGKSTIKINGNSATVGMLKKFTSKLVDVHGQSEHFYLLKTSNQLDLIDKFGGLEISQVKKEINELYENYKRVINDLNNLGGDEQNRETRLEILNHQINEILNADLKDGEEENLNELKKKINNQEYILKALNVVKDAISSENSAGDIVNYASKSIGSIADFSADYSELYDRLSAVYSELVDISDSASNLIDSFDFENTNIDYVENRLDLISSLKRKYGHSLDEINEYYINALIEKERLENFNEFAQNLLRKKSEEETELFNKYLILSEFRKKYSSIFASRIEDELKELGMNKARFEVNIESVSDFNSCPFNSANGVDKLEFMFSANHGEPLKPLSNVISGGEMSRFMLSIKAQTVKFNDICTFIFDEIDAGLSGKTAKIVAEKFAKLSKSAQIIAISHLPQISAMADNNLLISKSESEDTTNTFVNNLSIDEKINEIIRLVGGDSNSESAILLAKELIDGANKFKNNL